MDSIKRWLGILWMLIGPIVIIVLVRSALENIDPAGTNDINKPVPWIIVIAIFSPIAIGLMVFGWYAWKGEYNGEIKT